MSASTNTSVAATDVAIIGIACRLPGAEGVERFWQNLRDGVESVTFFSAEELEAEGVERELLADPRYVRAGTVLEDAECFDAAFFKLTPKEARILDPQHRLFLECAWNALEDAGYDGESYPGSIGLYAGSGFPTYLLRRPGDMAPNLISTAETFQTLVSNDKDFLATRTSYKLNLKGPSVTVQTACSTSLVAVHLACQNLLSGECDMALAGGVSVFLPQKTGYMSQDGMIGSPDGHCRPFDARANGTLKGNGLGIVVLKSLARAIEDGDRVYAVIKGSAVNNDGNTKLGYTAPSVEGQAEVIAEALAVADVDPATIDYVEAHGTGTPLGDPMEIEALAQVFAGVSPGSCAIGSLKSNMGHLDTAAGVGSLIKTVLALWKREIPPSLNFERPNPKIDFDRTPFFVNARLREWERRGHPRRAGVSSFGIGGTNAHVVLEEYAAPDSAPTAEDGRAYLLPLSARSPEALHTLVESCESLLARDGEALHDVCFTAGARRHHHEHRLAVAGASRATLRGKLAAHLRGDRVPGLASGRRPKEPAAPVFVFSGQGPQWWGMGRELCEQEPVFAAALARCDRELGSVAGWSLLEELARDGESSRLDQTELAQPALFALQVALASLWESWGIRPGAVVGHSVGELAAAHVAGVLDLEEAVRVVHRRGLLMQRATGQGRMASIELPEEEVAEHLARSGPRLSIAAVNSPTSTVVSGDPGALESLLAGLGERDVLFRVLPVDYAFHCPQMEPCAEELARALSDLVPSAETIPFYSTVTGARARGSELDAGYWGRNVRRTVRFADAVSAMIQDGRARHGVFLELAPHPVLLPMIARCLRARDVEGTLLPSLVRGRDEREVALEALGALHVEGADVAWSTLYPEGGRVARLPAYPWQRAHFWLPAEAPARRGNAVDARPTGLHPLLGRRVSSPLASIQFESRVDAESPSYLADHRFLGGAVFPAAAYLELALAAAQDLGGDEPCRIEGVSLHEVLALPEGGERRLQLVVERHQDGHADFRVFSRDGASDEGEWREHASGSWRGIEARVEGGGAEIEALRARFEGSGVAAGELYARFADHGFEYGPRFRLLEHVLFAPDAALASVALPDGVASEPHRFHPALLDACFQVLAAALSEEAGREAGVFVPVAVGSLALLRPPPSRLWVHATVSGEDAAPDTKSGELAVLDEDGRLVAEITGFRLRRTRRAAAPEPDVHVLEWEPLARGEAARRDVAGQRWLVLADAGGLGDELAARLRAAGAECLLVPAGEHDPLRPGSLSELLEREGVSRARPLSGVVHLAGLDAGATPTADALQEASVRLAGGVLGLVQALRASHPAPIWIVTRGAQAVGEGAAAPALAQAPLWGLGRVVALEHPELFGGLVDLGGGEDEAAALLDELTRPDGEDQVAIRDARRFVPRLERRDRPPAPPSAPWRADGTYLVTGGLGGLGLETARWIAAHGGGQLVLVGRRPASEARATVLEELRAAGARVEVLRADVARPADVARVVDRIRTTMPPLRGVIHAAGTLDDGMLVNQSIERFAGVLAPKVAGAWNLHLATREDPLDLFVVYSSITSLFGSHAQGSYAAANAFLDAFAHARRAEGLPALAIGWGPWSDVGMSAAQGERGEARRRALGMHTIAPRAGLELLERLIAGEHVHAGALSVDGSRLVGLYAGGRVPRLLARIQAGSAPVPPAGELGRRLRHEPAARARRLLRDHVRDEVARVLGLGREEIGLGRGLTEMGLDSLMAVELRNRLQASLGESLPTTLTFDYPTVNQLVDFLTGALAGPVDERAATLAPVPVETSFEPPDELTGEALLASFDEEMASVEALMQEYSDD